MTEGTAKKIWGWQHFWGDGLNFYGGDKHIWRREWQKMAGWAGRRWWGC